MSWLQGGPFLEVSFLMTLEADRHSFASGILTELKSFKPIVELATTEKELKEKIQEFSVGCLGDDEDPDSTNYHQTQISIYAHTDGKRKSVLSLRQISNGLVAVDFWFFGSAWDEPEWNQRGIAEDQILIFKGLLYNLFETFEFAIGTVGYENSVTDLFDTGNAWPNEEYRLSNINESSLQTGHYFSLIIANQDYVALRGIKGIKRDGKKLILEAES